MPEDNGETTKVVEDKILELASNIQVPLKREDISVAHRNGKKQGNKPRPILCKFVSRRTKDQMIENRNKLKNAGPAYNKVCIYKDLTQLRSKMLRLVKTRKEVHHAYTANGKIVACLKDQVNPENKVNLKKVFIDTPDDLFHLGFEEIPYKELGLDEMSI